MWCFESQSCGLPSNSFYEISLLRFNCLGCFKSGTWYSNLATTALHWKIHVSIAGCGCESPLCTQLPELSGWNDGTVLMRWNPKSWESGGQNPGFLKALCMRVQDRLSLLRYEALGEGRESAEAQLWLPFIVLLIGYPIVVIGFGVFGCWLWCVLFSAGVVLECGLGVSFVISWGWFIRWFCCCWGHDFFVFSSWSCVSVVFWFFACLGGGFFV